MEREIGSNIILKKKTYLRWKESREFLLSCAALILLSPLLLIVAIAIKLSDYRASILFKQIRIGKGGQKFLIYKFRTMSVDAEEQLNKYLKYNQVEGNMFKIKNDPRVTKLGKILRKTSIDELPQLWNVIKGDMALIGPRPPLEREVRNYTKTDKLRLSVKPGCTGLWQVSGRNELSFQQMVELDLKYIDEMNIWLDIKIILKTVLTMFFSKGAY